MEDEDKIINDVCDAIESNYVACDAIGINYVVQKISELLEKIGQRERTVWQKTRSPLICAVAANRFQMVFFLEIVSSIDKCFKAYLMTTIKSTALKN